MQGLIDRTEIFHPLKQHISIFKMEESEGLINFIYDDEAALPTGRLSFSDWKKKINSVINRGSRVICTGEWGYSKDYEDRFYREYNDYRVPNSPKQGVYEIHTHLVKERMQLCESQFAIAEKYWIDNSLEYKVTERKNARNTPEIKGHPLINPYSKGYAGEEYADFPLPHPLKQDEGQVYVTGYVTHLSLMYNPKGRVKHGWGDFENRERKNNLRFRVYQDDDQILNYDQISLDDIEFYLTSRIDRPNYLDMMPILETMKQMRLKELENEKSFVKFVFDRNFGKSNMIDSEFEERIWECVDWWKFKNKWKRPIEKDDTLALRMIEKRLLSKNYATLKKY